MRTWLNRNKLSARIFLSAIPAQTGNGLSGSLGNWKEQTLQQLLKHGIPMPVVTLCLIGIRPSLRLHACLQFSLPTTLHQRIPPRNGLPPLTKTLQASLVHLSQYEYAPVM